MRKYDEWKFFVNRAVIFPTTKNVCIPNTNANKVGVQLLFAVRYSLRDKNFRFFLSRLGREPAPHLAVRQTQTGRAEALHPLYFYTKE